MKTLKLLNPKLPKTGRIHKLHTKLKFIKLAEKWKYCYQAKNEHAGRKAENGEKQKENLLLQGINLNKPLTKSHDQKKLFLT